MEASKKVEYIPTEIIIEILQRLNVQSLLKFMCVSKLWLSLISSSKFKKTHLNHSTNSQNYANHHIILDAWRYRDLSFSCSLSSIFDNDKTAPLNTKTLTIQDSELFRRRIFGHCNGLLCFSVNAALFLYNPSTRKSKKLPVLVTCFMTYGLCYNESIDDYKLVELMDAVGQYGIKDNNLVSIYSLRTQSWINIITSDRLYFDRFDDLLDPGLPIGGVIYWEIYSKRRIIRVDTVTCTYETLERPYFDVPSRSVYWGILEFGGGLGLYREVSETCVEIWTMKSSWTKVLSIPYCRRMKTIRFPILGLKDGDILIYNNRRGRLKVYNSREDSYEYRLIPNTTRNLSVFAPYLVYIESLVEPS